MDVVDYMVEVSQKKIQKTVNGNASYIVFGDIKDSLKCSFVEDIKQGMGDKMSKLHDMRRQIEEDQMKRREELEAMQLSLNDERNNMLEDVM